MKDSPARKAWRMVSTNYFSGAVLICILTMLMIWWLPLLQVELGVAAFPNREGTILNILDVSSYLTMADALFILSFIVAVLGLALILTITVYIIMKTMYNNKQLERVDCTETVGFKAFVFVGLMVYFIFLSVAGLIHLLCIDNAEVSRSTIVLKAYNQDPVTWTQTRELAQQIYIGAEGTYVQNSFFFLSTGALLVGANGAIGYIEPSQFGTIRYQGTQMLTTALIAQLRASGMSFKAMAQTGTPGVSLSVVPDTNTYTVSSTTKGTYPDVLHTNFTNMALTSADLTDGSTFSTLLLKTYPNTNTALHFLDAMKNDMYMAASAMAYLTEARHHLMKNLLFGGTNDVIDLDVVAAEALRCEVGLAFGAYVMVISFFVVAIILLIMIFTAWCCSNMDEMMTNLLQGSGYTKLSNGDDTESLLGGGDKLSNNDRLSGTNKWMTPSGTTKTPYAL